MARKAVLDVDTGIDDALALLLALNSPELEVLGVTCVAGNITLDHVVRNTLNVVELAGASVPVAVGARKPLVAPLHTATYFHGANGLANIQLPPPRLKAIDQDAVSFLTETVRAYAKQVTVIAVGPLTNIALTVLHDPEFVGNLAGLIIMGGAISHPGNASGAAEANFRNDPEAAAAVARSGAPIQLVDLGATARTVLQPEQMDAAARRRLSPAADFALRLLQYYGPACMTAGASGAVLHDPLAAGLAALPDLARFIPLHLAVETAGHYSRGAAVGSFAAEVSRWAQANDHWDVVGLEPQVANASVARDIQASRFIQIFQERLGLLG